MAHKTQEINKTYKAQEAHESLQTLKAPPSQEPPSSHTGSSRETASDDTLVGVLVIQLPSGNPYSCK